MTGVMWPHRMTPRATRVERASAQRGAGDDHHCNTEFRSAGLRDWRTRMRARAVIAARGCDAADHSERGDIVQNEAAFARGQYALAFPAGHRADGGFECRRYP